MCPNMIVEVVRNPVACAVAMTSSHSLVDTLLAFSFTRARDHRESQLLFPVACPAQLFLSFSRYCDNDKPSVFAP